MSNPQVSHSKLSFSGRKRWRICPISVQMSEGMPDVSGPAAAEGTCAHKVAEFYIRQYFGLAAKHPGREPPQQTPPVGLDLSKYGATPEIQVAQWNETLRRHGRGYLDFVLKLIARYRVGDERVYVDVEERVAIPSIHAQLFGTLDLRIWFATSHRLIVVDYKFGFQDVDVGTPDDPNAQLAAYAVASMDQPGVPPASAYVLAVHQPRVPLGDAGKLLELPASWLADERRKLQNEVAAVENPGAPRPGDHCRYCKGASKCPATHGAAALAIEVHAGARSLLAMTDDELVQVWAARTAFKNFWEDVEERIGKLATTGHSGLQIKETAGRRMWKDPAMATLTFLAMGRVDLLQPIALSDAIGHLPAEFHDELVGKSRPSRSIVPVHDTAPHVIGDIFKKYANKS